MPNRKLRIGIVVGEVSGDTLGAKLMHSFREQGIEAEFEGIGGPQMIAAGFKSEYPMDILSIMGIVEVVKDLRQLFKVRDGLIEKWKQHPIDIFIGIDAPDFNLRVSKCLKQKQPLTKTVQYVSPSVWAWRQSRVHSIKKNIDLVLCLFPFEKVFYQQWQVPAAFVGHPLASQLALKHDVQQARQELNLQHTHYIALLPGSRKGEVERLGHLVIEAAYILMDRYPQYHFLIPAINAARYQQIQQLLAAYPTALQQRVHILENTAIESKIGRQVMAAADIVALASGTATLEAMLLHRPMVTFYKLNWLTYQIAQKMIKIPYVSLPNIIAGKKVIQELVQDQATPAHLAAEIEKLMDIEVAQIQMMQHLTMHKQLLAGNSENPVEVIMQLVHSQ